MGQDALVYPSRDAGLRIGALEYDVFSDTITICIQKGSFLQ